MLYTTLMNSSQVRSRFLEYYKERGHEIVPSSPLVPENDPTTLFTSSGMQPMLSYFLGEPYPSGSSRIVDSQKCFRAMDIEEVGDNRHTTFFEMLGNWSFGDYWKKEQLRWIFEFLVDEIGLNPQNLYISVFIGDEKNGISKDTESVEIWEKLFSEKGIEAKVIELGSEQKGAELGMQEGRIFYYDAKKNWWSRAGIPELMPIGEPGGPDSEIFYDFGTEHDNKYGEKCHPNCDCGRFLEIANSVFMEFKKIAEGKFEPLPKKNVDFGGGLERITAAKNDDPDVFKIDLIKPAIDLASEAVVGTYEENSEQLRVIADHLRGATFMIAEGIEPSNKLQGYVLRRLIRRAAVKMYELNGDTQPISLFTNICDSYVDAYGEMYFDPSSAKQKIAEQIASELKKFGKSLDKGLKQIEKTDISSMDAKFAFDLYQTYGFPLEITQEILHPRGVIINEEEFEAEKAKHQGLSKTASAGAFKGGLGDSSKKTVWYHTLTHLLHQALRDVLGEHVHQAGSNITPERLRFDFSHDKAMTLEEIELVEKIVNDQKNRNLNVKMESLPLQEALDSGALAFFKEKYSDIVNVYSVGDYSKEICGGPHVKNTSEIEGVFRIDKESSSGAGVRRIKAVIE